MKSDLVGAMPPQTLRLFEELSSYEELKRWVLVGGTALSIHLHHRLSEDLDFFIASHQIDKSLRREIDQVAQRLTETGHMVQFLTNEEDQVDLSVSGTKLTFHATTAISLKSEHSHGTIQIGSTQMIGAMKMRAVLKHRIMSRDFYDLKTLIEGGHSSFHQLMHALQEHYPAYRVTAKLVSDRFLKSKQSAKDPGLNTLLTQAPSFSQLRAYFVGLFTQIERHINEAITLIESDLGHIATLARQRYGLTNATLEQILAIHDEDDLLARVLDAGSGPCDCLNAAGEDLLWLLRNKPALFRKALERTVTFNEAPSMAIKLEGEPNLIEWIEAEKVVNRMMKHLDNRSEFDRIAREKGWEPDTLFLRASNKRARTAT